VEQSLGFFAERLGEPEIIRPGNGSRLAVPYFGEIGRGFGHMLARDALEHTVHGAAEEKWVGVRKSVQHVGGRFNAKQAFNEYLPRASRAAFDRGDEE